MSVTLAENLGLYLRPSGTSRILNMPYACFDSQKCAPYKVKLLPGQYKIELWGGSGGDVKPLRYNTLVSGGLGGYVKGILSISDPLSIFIYVGAKGYNANTASYNGGGRGPLLDPSDQGQGAGGGGATDIRIIPSRSQSDDEIDEISLKSRLMVAGAGGGACSYQQGSRGGNNLGLQGENGVLVINAGDLPGTPPTGGTQNTPGEGYIPENEAWSQASPGSLGRGGGFSESLTGAGAGGAGFYGGGSGGVGPNVVSSGAAGSSFINLSVISDPVILGGKDTIPSPLGVNETGHYGDGFARITVEMGGFELPPSFLRRKYKSVHIASMMLIELLRE